MFKFVNTVGWKNDVNSFRKLKKEAQSLKKTIDDVFKNVKPLGSGGGGGGSPRKVISEQEAITAAMEKRLNKEIKREMDLHKIKQKNLKQFEKERKEAEKQLANSQAAKIRQAVGGITSGSGAGKAKDSIFADMLRAEEGQDKFNRKQDEMIRNFMISNRLIREKTKEQKEQLELQLREAKTLQDVRFKMREIRSLEQDRVAKQKQVSREMEQQNALVKRMKSSYMQLGTTIASAYTLVAGGQAILQTGMAFESIEKTLLSVTGTSEAAAKEMEFLSGEAERLGINLKEGGKAYAKLLAAGKGKLPLQDIRDTFLAVTEAGTVLGLNQDDMSGGIRA